MPEVTGNTKVAGEALVRGLLTERSRVIGEGLLLADVLPIQPRLIGAVLLLAIVEQVYAPTSVRRVPVKGDILWQDQ